MNADLKAFFKQQDALPGNGVCFECKQPDSSWASVTFGIYLCHTCSGQHRAMGSHISFVRSCLMDTWTQPQLNLMAYVGNTLFEEYLAQHLGPDFRSKHRDFSMRYTTQACLNFKNELKQSMDLETPASSRAESRTPSPRGEVQQQRQVTSNSCGTVGCSCGEYFATCRQSISSP